MLVSNASEDKKVRGPLTQSCRNTNRSAANVENPVLGPIYGSGIMHIEGHPNLAKINVALTVSGVMNVTQGRPFYTLVTNFSVRSIHLPKHVLVVVGGDELAYIVQMVGD